MQNVRGARRPVPQIAASLTLAFFVSMGTSAGAAAHKKHPKTVVSGSVRTYWFNRSATDSVNETAENTAFRLHLEHEAVVPNLVVGATAVALNTFGGNNRPADQLNATLPPTSFNTLDEAYLKYANARTSAVAGYQTLDTPWANAADTRIIPATFSAISASGTFGSDWMGLLAREFSWKPRTQGGFSANNLLTNATTPGFLVGGLTYAHDRYGLGLWQYGFYQVANQTYAQASMPLASPSYAPILAVQYDAQPSSGSALAGTMHSYVDGAQLRDRIHSVNLSIAYDRAFLIPGTFHNGGPAAIYSYSSDPLFTTMMVTGLYNINASWSYKALLDTPLDRERFHVLFAHAQYFGLAKSRLSSTENDVDIAWHLTPRISLRERLGYLTSTQTPPDKIESRLQFEYTVPTPPHS